MALQGPVEESLVADIQQDELARQQRIARAWRHYNGQHDKCMEAAPDGTDDSVRLALARKLVNTGVRYLFGKLAHGVDFTVEADTPADEEQGEADAETLDLDADRLDEVWAPEERALTLFKLAVNGGVTGHVFAKLIEVPAPRVVAVDPSNMTVDWDGDDYEQVTRYTITWTAYDSLTKQVEARRQRIEPLPDAANPTSWELTTERSSGGDTWAPIGAPVTWAHTYAPIVHCQNLPAPNEFWGYADLEPDVLDLIEALEAVISGGRKLVRHFGHPIPYVTGPGADKVALMDTSTGRLLKIPDGEANVGMLEMTGDLVATVALYEKLRSAFHMATDLPEVATGKLDNIGQLSGLAISILYGPILERTGEKRLTYGPFVRDLAERLLDLAGAGQKAVTLGWPELTPRDPQADVNVLEGDQRMGIVSRHTIAHARGYDFDHEQQLIADEDQESTDNARALMDLIAAGGGPTAALRDLLTGEGPDTPPAPTPPEGE